jgi:hypothetical protein
VGIGCAVALWFYGMNDGIQTSKTAFILFIGEQMNKRNLLSEYIFLNPPVSVFRHCIGYIIKFDEFT